MKMEDWLANVHMTDPSRKIVRPVNTTDFGEKTVHAFPKLFECVLVYEYQHLEGGMSIHKNSQWFKCTGRHAVCSRIPSYIIYLTEVVSETWYGDRHNGQVL